MLRSELEQTLRQKVLRTIARLAILGRGCAIRGRLALQTPLVQPPPLRVDPRPLALGERLCLKLRSPARYGHPDGAVFSNPNDISTGLWVADKLERVLGVG